MIPETCHIVADTATTWIREPTMPPCVVPFMVSVSIVAAHESITDVVVDRLVLLNAAVVVTKAPAKPWQHRAADTVGSELNYVSTTPWS